jgi:predicted transposase YbfD/YdcC
VLAGNLLGAPLAERGLAVLALTGGWPAAVVLGLIAGLALVAWASSARAVRLVRREATAPVPPGAAQVAQLRRTVTAKGTRTVEVVYVITSADAHTAPPATLAAWVQGHWPVANKPHHVRDVAYAEDASRVCVLSYPGARTDASLPWG